MKWDDFTAAFNEAQATINIADRHVATMARVVSGRLKKCNVPSYILCELKRELEAFNMHTKTWRE